MTRLLVKGGRTVAGEIAIQGAKTACCRSWRPRYSTGETVLRRCPRLRDVDTSIRILQHLGCEARWEGEALVVDSSGLHNCGISDILMREMRSSAIFLGAILTRCGQADLSYPGAASWGPGPLISTWRGCGNWEPRFRRRADGCTVWRLTCADGKLF